MTERCEGRYPVPGRSEPFEVTYRCGLHHGHHGPCAAARCGHRSGDLVCDREANHEGNHRGYNEQIDEAMFWSTTCRARHSSGVRCELPEGHTVNHKGADAHAVYQWPDSLEGPAGGARGCTQAEQRTPQSTGTLHHEPFPATHDDDNTAVVRSLVNDVLAHGHSSLLISVTRVKQLLDERDETQDSILMAVKADRAAIADFLLSCREGGNMTNVVQVFDVLASKIRNGEHLTLPVR